MSTNLPIEKDKAIIAPPRFEPDKHRDRLKKFKLTKEQENEMLQMLWNIARMMAEMGQGVEQTQVVLNSIFKKAGYDSDKLVQLEDNLNQEKESP